MEAIILYALLTFTQGLSCPDGRIIPDLIEGDYSLELYCDESLIDPYESFGTGQESNWDN